MNLCGGHAFPVESGLNRPPEPAEDDHGGMSSAPGRLRRGIVIGALAVGLAGAGGAAVWATTTATPTPTPSGTASAPPQPGGHGFGHGLHGEVTVKKSDGTFSTIVSQRGTVTEITGTKLTVRSEDGYEHSYTLNAQTGIRAAADRDTALAASDLKSGDEVAVRAVRSGSEDTAEHVVASRRAIQYGAL